MSRRACVAWYSIAGAQGMLYVLIGLNWWQIAVTVGAGRLVAGTLIKLERL